VGLMGILKAGGVYLPLDPDYPEERLRYMMEDARIAALLTMSGVEERLSASWMHGIGLDTEREIWRQVKTNPGVRVEAENAAYVIYTSGSTGRPKGVAISHGSLANLAQTQTKAFVIHEDSSVLQFASCSFDAAVSEWSTALSIGAMLVLRGKGELLPGDGLRRVLQEVTVVTLPPSLLEAMEEEDLGTVETLVVAGEACGTALVNKYAGRVERMLNAYGPTEVTVCASISGSLKAMERVPIGKPMANTRAYVLDERMEVVPIGVVGELYVGGVGVARGYVSSADLTAGKFLPDLFSDTAGGRLYRTGDRVRWRKEGELEYVGRMDEQVKLRGYRIEVGEIEAVLN
jgi:amino acid adenylation domain-containing protein